ncbi:MAG: bifunctional aspartate kinase/homoserine dehydrogenase I, partial [Paramuribaculum sp.]|nr:bifunctional aspartate kinase/homoserine dehydrogenase I [Paramuribaculum sp.]
HTDVIKGIVSPGFRNSVETEVASMLAELERIYLGVYYVADLSERVLARIVSYGERMSSVIVSGIIDGITLRDSMQFIRTVSCRGRNRLDTEATSRLVAEHLAEASMPGALTLVQGFISTDASGEITNLGRGGSDYTAA